nr:reverse transcriptase domain-containing protein [Tanacetum cinerariifolium]
MQTRSSSKFVSESSLNPISTNLKHRNRRRSKPRFEPFSIPIVTMADNRTMGEMLQAPTEGYGDAIVVPDILAENFKIKTGLLSLIQANQFHGFESNNPHDHIRSFNRITSTLKFRDVPNDAIKLMLFPYSLEGQLKFVSITSSGNSSSTDARIDKLMDTISNLVETFNKKMTTPTTVKAVKETCVICGGAYPYYDCIATDSNISSACATTDQVLTGTTNNVPPLVVQSSPAFTSSTPISSLKIPESNPHQPLVAQTQVPIDEPVVAQKSKPTIPYPSRANKQKLHDSTSRHSRRRFSKSRKVPFSNRFVIVDYVVDPHVPLILGRPFLRTGRALIDVYGEKLTLRVDDEAITFKVGQTSKYSYNDAESINQIDVQEVLGFSDKSKSGSPISTSNLIISSSSPSFTPFEGSDFILEEIETFLRTPNNLSNLDDDYYDTEGDILYLEKLLNEDPSSNLPPVKTEDLKQVNATMIKPSIEKPPELELKELLSHLEYVFLEGTDKLPVIISKELKDEEKSALLKVRKSHKRAIAWKISDIKGIGPRFCTHKLLMEDDFIKEGLIQKFMKSSKRKLSNYLMPD